MNGQLASEAEELRLKGYGLQLHPQNDGWIFTVIDQYPVPEGFNQPNTSILIKMPPNYPLGGLDMFWTDSQLRLAGGGLPVNTSIEQYLGRPWLRFSWHPQKWNPSSDSLASYLKFIDKRLEQRQ
jgi:hypothetical protein